jgi:hypothetical protein
MQPIVITIEDGIARFLVSDQTRVFMEPGQVTKRASHVEPDGIVLRKCFHIIRQLFGEKGFIAGLTRQWPCIWRVNLGPVNGPVLATRYTDRQEAIESEIEWLNQNFI